MKDFCNKCDYPLDSKEHILGCGLKQSAENFTDNYSETKSNTFIAGAEWMKEIFIKMIDERLKRNQGEFDAGSRHELNTLRDILK